MSGRFLLCAAFALVTAVAYLSPPGQRLEREVGLEALYTLRGPIEPPDGALVIGLDRGSVNWLQRNVRELGDVAPSLGPCLSERARDAIAEARNVNHIPRGLYACLVRQLARHEPSLIVFDVSFNVEKPQDDALAAAIREAGNVILLEKVIIDAPRSPQGAASLTVRLHPVKALREAALASAGFQVDGWSGQVTTSYLRRFPQFPNLEVLPEAAWTRVERRELPAGLESRDLQLIWLYGPPGTVPTRLLRDVYDARSASPLPEKLTGTVVFVGASDPSHGTIDDHFRVPAVGGGGHLMGGVELAATAYLNLLHGQILWSPPIGTSGALVFIFGFALAVAALVYPGSREILVILALAACYGLVVLLSFSEIRLWLPAAVPLILAMPAAILMTLENRYRLASSLVVRLAPRQFAERLLRAPQSHLHGTQAERGTVMFTDVVGSTSLGEQMPESEFIDLMTTYYDRATSAVEAYGGMVVDYRGDGVLAVFTESVAGKDHATRACRAALDICAGMRGAAPADLGDRAPRLQLRIGLNSGRLATGAVGARDRFNYNVLGDNVNVAARLEQLGKDFGDDGHDMIIVNETTRRSAALADESFELLGDIRLRGRQSTTAVYRLHEPPAPH